MKKILLSLALVFTASPALAFDCYALVSSGVARATGLAEYPHAQVFWSKYATLRYRIDGKSHPQHMGLGCVTPYPSISVEVSQWWGMEAWITADGALSPPGMTAIPFKLTLGAKINGTSVVARYSGPKFGNLTPAIGIGALKGTEYLYVYSEQEINGIKYLHQEKSGALPILNVGVVWSLDKQLALRLDGYRFNSKLTSFMLGLEGRF